MPIDNNSPGKFVAYHEGGFVVTKEASEVVQASGSVEFLHTTTLNGLVKVGTELIANLNAEMLDGAQRSENSVMKAGEHAAIPTEGAVHDFVVSAVTPVQEELNGTQTGAGLEDDGSYTAHVGSQYIGGATSLHNADWLLDQAIKTVSTTLSSSGNVFNYVGTQLVSNNQSSPTILSEVLTEKDTGDYYRVEVFGIQGQPLVGFVQWTAESQLVFVKPGDAIVINADATGFDHIDNTNSHIMGSSEFISVSGDSDVGYTVDIAAEFKERMTKAEADIIANAGDIAQNSADIKALQSEVDATQAGAGLSAEGAYLPEAGAEYISGATTLHGASIALDGALKTESGARVAADSALQTELDTTQAGAGLAENGTYSANTSANYIQAATSLKDADNKLDTALKAEETARIAADSAEEAARIAADDLLADAIQAEEDARIAADDAATTDRAAIRSEFAAADLAEKNERTAADDAATTDRAAIRSEFAAADAAIQSELDATQVGAGLGTEGAYTAHADSSFITGATSLHNADKVLDVALKAEETARIASDNLLGDAIQAEEDARIAADDLLGDALQAEEDARIAADGVLQNNINAEAAARLAADGVLQGNIDAEESARIAGDNALQTELDNTQVGAGLDADGSYLAEAGAKYISGATSLRAADVILDEALKLVDARVGSLEGFGTTGIQWKPSVKDLAELEASVIGDSEPDAGDAFFVRDAGDIYVLVYDRVVNGQPSYDYQPTSPEWEAFVAEESAPDFHAGFVKMADLSEISGIVADEKQERIDADAAIQSELDTTQAGAGLNTNGTYSPKADANYISAATTLTDADNKLDAALKAEEVARQAADSQLANDIEGERNRAIAAEGVLQDNIDAEEAARIAADGVLQGNIDAEEAARIAADGVLQGNIDAEAATRLAADNAATTDRGLIRSEFAAADDALEAELRGGFEFSMSDLETMINDEEARALAAENAIKSELDLTQAGAGLAADGTYSAPEVSDFLAGSTSLFDADLKLDKAVKDEEIARIAADGVLQNNIDAVSLTVNSQPLVGSAGDDWYVNLKTEKVVYAEGENVTVSLFQPAESNELQVKMDLTPTVKAEAFAQSIELVAGESVSFGDLLAISADGEVSKATHATAQGSRIIGMMWSEGTKAPTELVKIAIAGQVLSAVSMQGAVQTAGMKVYLTANGQMTTDVPASGSVVHVGTLVDARPESRRVFFNPQIVAMV